MSREEYEKLLEQAQSVSDKDETPTTTPTPEPAVETTTEPTTYKTAEEELSEFTEKLAGVWGSDNGYFIIHEGNAIKRGWFESEMLPEAYVFEVFQLKKNYYEVIIKDKSEENELYSYSSDDIIAMYDGTRDEFKETFVMTIDDVPSLYVRMGDNFDEAMDYEFNRGFESDLANLKEEILAPIYQASGAVGTWLTEDYDEVNNWAGSYKIELTDDGKATCTGWRNRDTGHYAIKDDNHVLIKFNYCETDSPEGGWMPVRDFTYTIDMTINGDDAQIKIDAPDVISNLSDGKVHRK